MEHGKHSKEDRKKMLAGIFHEVKHNTPSTVKRANVSGKRKRRMEVAIALSKARKAGMKIPKK